MILYLGGCKHFQQARTLLETITVPDQEVIILFFSVDFALATFRRNSALYSLCIDLICLVRPIEKGETTLYTLVGMYLIIIRPWIIGHCDILM